MSRPLPTGAALGIDFGTSHTTAVVRRADGSVRPLLFDGSPMMPSAVCADADGDLLVGRDAVHSGRRHPERFEPNPKRHIDRGSVLLGQTEFPLTDIIAAVLRTVAHECGRVVGIPAQVTVTVPAEWGPARRQTVEDAATAAGLGAVRMLPEPVAAATYFAESLKHHVAVGSAVVVYDLGAGTFDASVVRRTERGFDTIALDGRSDLGGLDIDAALIEHLTGTYGTHPGWQRLTNPTTVEERRAYRDFQEEIRTAKESLSRRQQADFSIPLLDIDAHLTRAELEQIAAPHLSQTIRLTQAVVRTAGLDLAASAGVFLVGGASRMPLVATMLHRELGIAPTVLDQPEVVVAEGSVLWVASQPQPLTPPAAPRAPQYAPITPTASPALRGYPPAPTPQAPAPVPPPPQSSPPRARIEEDVVPFTPQNPEKRAKAKKASRRIVLAVVIVDILIVAALIFIFRPDAEADDTASNGYSLGEALAETATLDQIGTDLEAHGDGTDTPVTAMAATTTDEGAMLFTAGADQTVRQWNLDTNELLEARVFDHDVNALTVIERSDGRSMVLAIDGDRALYTWGPAAFEPELVLESVGDPQRLAVGTHDGHAALAAMTDEGYGVLDLENREDAIGVEFTEAQSYGYSNFAVFEDRINVVTAFADGSLQLYDAATGETDGQAFGPEGSDWTDGIDNVEALRALTVDGVPHAMVRSGETYHAWNLDAREFAVAAEFDGSDADYMHHTMKLERDGATDQAFLTYGTEANLWSMDDGTTLKHLATASGAAVSAATSLEVDRYTIAITGSADGYVRLWNLGRAA